VKDWLWHLFNDPIRDNPWSLVLLVVVVFGGGWLYFWFGGRRR
jgi:hypothetical protein